MNAGIDINAKLTGRHSTDAVARASCRWPLSDFVEVEIFKKTPCFPDLKRAGRDVAKDILEISNIPLTTDVWFDNALLLDDEKLAGASPTNFETKSGPGQTKHTLDARWEYIRQAGSVMGEGFIHLGGAHEKKFYAGS